MYRNLLLLVIAVASVTASEQTLSFYGKVTNKSNKAIAGALVTALYSKTADTTDENGIYSFSASMSVHPIQVLPCERAISLRDGVLSIGLLKQTPVIIEIFDTRGMLLERLNNAWLPSGKFRFDIRAYHFAVNMMLIRVSVGNDIALLRYLPFGDFSRSVTSSLSTPANAGRIATINPVIDSLIVAANGYLRKTAPVSSYKDTVNFVLDTLSLAKFSFFVTSLKALRELSGNPMGFGGDLRFGKTGPGAGLLGADSICQCIAEKSMPGSKVKEWRAFLSVAVGPDGNQVNAIDRIGQGPWYDRRGRVVALTIDDLKWDRPLNIDAAIQEDLPNEDGIPNHQPDPNLPAVDNHLTITGSDNLGMLYSPTSTCEDWTTASATTYSLPRSGLSWTRNSYPIAAPGKGGGGTGFNTRNWISFWDLPGCVAGIDSTDSSGAGDPTSKFIGAGGGYGGFYCFSQNP
jgi:hypothetical protein